MTKVCTICLKEGHNANNYPDGEAFRRSSLKREHVLTEIIKAGAAGINSGELRKITGYGVGSIDCALRQLSDKGLVFLGGHGTGMRRFSRQEWADEYHTETSLDVAMDRIARILADVGDDGVNNTALKEMTGLEDRRLSEAIITMRKAGRLFSTGKNSTFRNFATDRQAKDHVIRCAQKRLEKKKPKLKTNAKPGRMLVIKARSVHEPKLTDTRVIIPEGVKITRAPTPEPRFGVSGPVIGEFATMRPGQYIQADTWAARALGGQ